MLADAAFVIITVAGAVFVGSLADVAVIVALPPAGTDAGAVYVVIAPLAVADTLNVPHEPLGAQLHTTGIAAGSFVVVAAIDAVAPVCIAPGGGVVSVIVITGPVIVTVAFFVGLGALTAVAVIVTLPPDGAVIGAVYVVAAPLAVAVELKLPQVPTGVQLHVTPPFAGSFRTVAEIFAVPDIPRLAGGAARKFTEMSCWPPPEEPPPQPAATKTRTTVVRMSVFLMAFPP